MKTGISAVSNVKWSDRWGTHPELFLYFDKKYHFTLDVCAEPETAKCVNFFTPLENGLEQNWDSNTCWCNPPYSNPMPWVVKAIESIKTGSTVIMLVRDDCSTRWYNLAAQYALDIYRFLGRLSFKHPEQSLSHSVASFSNAAFVFHPDHKCGVPPRHIYVNMKEVFTE